MTARGMRGQFGGSDTLGPVPSQSTDMAWESIVVGHLLTLLMPSHRARWPLSGIGRHVLGTGLA